MSAQKALRLANPVLAVICGLLAGRAIRAAVHGHPWLLLASLAAVALAGAAAAIWLSHRAERRALLDFRAFLLKMQAEVPGMVEDAMGESACGECGGSGPCPSPSYCWPGGAPDGSETDEPPRAETDCRCQSGGFEDCPCEADGPDGLCRCCRDGDHEGSCFAPVPGTGTGERP